MVELADVGWRAGNQDILSRVSATFRPNAFNVILGPNGAGKSTMLRLATGLLSPSSGRVLYDGVDLREIGREDLARRRAVLSQHVELAFPLPSRDVAMMGRYPHFGQTPTSRDRDIVERALALVGIDHKSDQAYPTLSGGEQQKVHLARVLAQIWNDEDGDDHKILFLDEPTTSLDIHFQIHLLDVARQLTALDCTVVAVLHDINVAFQYGQAFFVLDQGRLVHVADDADGVDGPLIERIFRVKAHRVPDPGGARALWRFSL